MSQPDTDTLSTSTQTIEADIDSDYSDDINFDDDDDDWIDLSPFPNHCEDEIEGIESFYRCFQRRYKRCPVFSIGSLCEALQVAFNPPSNDQKRLPVLVYIHNEKAVSSNLFCKTIFCHNEIVDYLSDNYIVWPWDVTLESNRDTLNRIWEELFNSKFVEEFSIDDCPLLIGITRQFEYKTGELDITEYECKALFKDDTLTRSQMIMNFEGLLEVLDNFKNRFSKNELCMSLKFHKMAGLPWEIILQIVKYLSLNDAISAFSTDILCLLDNSQLNFQLTNPSISTIKIILQNFQAKQIVSLQLTTIKKWLEKHLNIFQNVISITLLNQPHKNEIIYLNKYFPSLTCLSFCYDDEIDLNEFNQIFHQFSHQTKRLEINCAGILCRHYDTTFLTKSYLENSTVQYCLIDVRYFPLISSDQCSMSHSSCFLKSIIDFIKRMTCIQHVHLVINKNDIEQLLNINDWTALLNRYSQLKKITIEVLGNTFQNEQLEEQAMYIQNELRNTRETVKFQIKFI
ncbi:unnamed protein product [Adineta steineri]|uniref:UAS domain-containing protein n=1 Tax=Adineta steineri TaxID=433720 RepID=A0A819NTK3_9BILA|nr:unnamed protein product [Adineta steineri]CAF4003195.1 unnamed protein product [Adineta steineri]